MTLVEPSIEYDKQIQAFRKEFIELGYSMDGCGSLERYVITQDWINRTKAWNKLATTPPNRVPTTQYMYIRESDCKIVGMIQIRHFLSEILERYSGHIGFSVCPSERRKGYATEMLRDALSKCSSLNIRKVLISCTIENEASRRTILKNGGVYESTVYWEDMGIYLERYWIDIP